MGANNLTPNARPLEILIVDDDASNLKSLSVELVANGFKIRSALSGAAAIDLFHDHHSTIDIVLTDVEMSNLDGPHLVSQMRAVNSRIRFIFMADNEGKYSIEDLLEYGASDVLRKPFRGLDVVVQSLREAHGEAGCVHIPSR